MKSVLNLFLILGLLAIAVGQTQYRRYTNGRFAYSISYPSSFLRPSKIPDQSNSGEIFSSVDNSIEMRVWGEYNAADKTFQEQYESDLKDFSERPTYTVLKNDWYVLSGIKDGRIYYQKTLQRKLKTIDVFYTFTIEYPESKQTQFDGIVRRIAASFRFDPNADI